MSNNIAIIIPSFNRKHLLIPCLKLLMAQTVKPAVMIVVNDGSTDGTSELLASDFPEIIQLKGDGNLWWTGSVNMGINHVILNFPEIEGIILQNDDVEFENTWIENLLSVVEKNPNALIGCVGVDIRDNSTIDYAGKFTHPWFAYSRYFNKGKKISNFSSDLVTESFDLIGRGIYIPRDVFVKLGVFDSLHFKQCGDTELPLRAKYAGYKLLVTYKAIVKVRTDQTSEIDIKNFYKISDFKRKFFDFRSSAYWKYRFYYGKILAQGNPIKHYSYFLCRMSIHFAKFLIRFRFF